MAERRPIGLLDFAIAASAAIVPVLLGVLLLVAVVRPADPTAPTRRALADRYVSVRHVAALKTFESAIVARDGSARALPDAAAVLAAVPACRREWSGSGGAVERLLRSLHDAPAPTTPAERIVAELGALDLALQRFGARAGVRVERPPALDPARWFDAANRALETAVESPDYPGRRFRVGCADLAGALATVARADARLLDRLAWRGSASRATVARWPPEQQVAVGAGQVMRRDPWSGVAGCVYLGLPFDAATALPRAFVAAPRSVQHRLCALPALAAREVGPAASVGRGDAKSAGVGAPPDGMTDALHGTGAAGRPTIDGRSGADARPMTVAVARAPAAPDRTTPTPEALAGEPGADDAADDPRWQVPPSLQAMLQPLEALRQPSTLRYRRLTEGDERLTAAGGGALPRHGFNRVRLDGVAVDAGFSIDLTIDPALQALAQKTAACYTGRHDVCRALGLRRAEDRDGAPGRALLEGAMVRMAAVAVVDVASGRIEALAGARSPCARRALDGRSAGAACDPRLPAPDRTRPDALLNPAVFHDAMPASTIKPIMAAAFLADPDVGARWLAAEQAAMQRGDAVPPAGGLRGQLMRSDSARFLDRLFCLDRDAARCARPWAVQAEAAVFGWNAGCPDTGAIGCGRQDLLFGQVPASPVAAARATAFSPAPAGPSARPSPSSGALSTPTSSTVPLPTGSAAALPALALPVAYGRLLSEPVGSALGAAMHLRPPTALDATILKRCAAGADGRRFSDDDWTRCRGGAVVDVVAEGWGQGHARASALGVAGMMATLAAAANGQPSMRRPHLVESLRGVAGSPALDVAELGLVGAAPQPIGLAAAAAGVILNGLSYSHRAGTARTACEQVFDARRCRSLDWLAGKTGTPSFPSDGVPLDELARRCHGDAAARAALKPGACSPLRPYKWYVAAFRDPGDPAGAWTKAIAVLTERNWVKASGQVHGAGDHGPNPAAEIAMQIAARRVGAIGPAGEAARSPPADKVKRDGRATRAAAGPPASTGASLGTPEGSGASSLHAAAGATR